MSEHKEIIFSAVDLFAGIGGIRLGFEKSFEKRIETNLVVEIDERAQKTYKANFELPKDIQGDITTFTDEYIFSLKNFDICLAGFPCQAFSTAGNKNGFDDDHNGVNRGKLFFEVARICEKKRPMVILCENVKGLEHHKGGETLNAIKEKLNEIGYDVYTKVLNSKNFDVPQKRERLYIVALRKDIELEDKEFKFPISIRSTEKKLEDILEEDAVETKYYLSERYLNTLKKHKEEQKAKGNGFGYKIRKNTDVAGTLMCGGMGKERNLIEDKKRTKFDTATNIRGAVNNEFIRRLTPRECARLQGFPNEFKFVVAETHLYNQFGNTVTVPVIEAIANNILKVIDNHISNGGKRFIQDDNSQTDD